MTHLRIEQNTTGIEEVSGAVIAKLYDLVHSGTLDSTSNLQGRLHTTATYRDYQTYLQGQFDGTNNRGPLYIDANNFYKKFTDPVIEATLSTVYGDGTGITETQLATINLGTSNQTLFKDNTSITSFNELSQTNTTSLADSAFSGCTNLVDLDLSNITSIGDFTFYNCSALSINNLDLRNITSLKRGVFYGCSSLTGILDLSNGSWASNVIFEQCFYGCSGLAEIRLGDLIQIGTNRSNNNRTPFYNCTNLKIVDIKSLGSFSIYGAGGNALFKGCPNIKALVIRSATVPQFTYQTNSPNPVTGLFYWFTGDNNNTAFKIYVPDAAVNDYKSDSQFSYVASYIYPLSEYNESTILAS